MESGAAANESSSGPLNYRAAEDVVHFCRKAAAKKRRRSGDILLVFRALTFAFSLAAVLVMGTNKHGIRNTQSQVCVGREWHHLCVFVCGDVAGGVHFRPGHPSLT